MSSKKIVTFDQQQQGLTPKQPIKLTKRDVIKFLYKDFLIQVYEHIDLSHIFPSYENVDVADLVFNISFSFPIACNVEDAIRNLIILKNITCTENQILLVIPIIDKFIKEFYSI